MLRILLLIVALAFPLPAYAWPGTVLDVHDGDRMIVAPMGDVRTPLKIRLYGIDAPELEQKGGPQSRDHLLSLVRPGQDVEVIKMSTDKYGRTVALVATDRVLNADMLEAWSGVGVSGLLQRAVLQRLEEAGTGRQRSAAGPVVPKGPDPAVEVAAEAEMKKAPGCFDPRALFYWLGGVRPGAGFTASMSSCGTSSNMR